MKKTQKKFLTNLAMYAEEIGDKEIGYRRDGSQFRTTQAEPRPKGALEPGAAHYEVLAGNPQLSRLYIILAQLMAAVVPVDEHLPSAGFEHSR